METRDLSLRDLIAEHRASYSTDAEVLSAVIGGKNALRISESVIKPGATG